MNDKKLSNQELEEVVDRLYNELSQRREQIEQLEEVIRKQAGGHSQLKLVAAVKSIIQERDDVSKKLWNATEQLREVGKTITRSLEPEKKLVRAKEMIDKFFKNERK